ncbi:YhbY family RNA-binding protein, partial [Acinetobacter baumannii]
YWFYLIEGQLGFAETSSRTRTPMLNLTPAERSELRAQAHGLNPVVMVGESGLTESVMKEIDKSLNAHGLIKVRVFGDDREARIAIYETICAEL